MTTEFGYTERGEYLPIVAEPFLQIAFPREEFVNAQPDDQAAIYYLVQGASVLHDRWTVRQSFLWDAILIECWIARG